MKIKPSEKFQKIQVLDIKSQLNTHQKKNGLAKRLIRIIEERAKSMLLDAKQAKALGAEAVSTAVYLINRSPQQRSVTKISLKIRWNVKHLFTYRRTTTNEYFRTSFRLIRKTR